MDGWMDVQRNVECEKEGKTRVQARCSRWKRMSGVICDRRVGARVKGKVFKMVVRLALLYDLETAAPTKRQEAELKK